MIQKVKVHNYRHTLTHMHLLFEVMAVVVGDIVVGDIVVGDIVIGDIVVVGGGVRMTFGGHVRPLA